MNERIERFQRMIREDRIIRGACTRGRQKECLQGRQKACLLAALAPEVMKRGRGNYSRRAAEVIRHRQEHEAFMAGEQRA